MTSCCTPSKIGMGREERTFFSERKFFHFRLLLLRKLNVFDTVVSLTKSTDILLNEILVS